MLNDLAGSNFLALGAGALVFATVLVAIFATGGREAVEARIRAVTTLRRARPSTDTRSTSRQGRAAAVGFMRRIVLRLNLLRSRQTNDIQARLARAGWRSRDALVIYLFSRLCFPFLIGAAALFVLYGLELFTLEPMMKLVGVVGAMLIGLVVPSVFVRNMAERRRANIRKGLPDALDLLVICTEAGLSLDAGLVRVAGEISKTWRELAEEIELTSSELGMLSDRKQALDNLRQRIDLPAVNALCTTLLQTEKFGTPLAQALRVLASELREERMMRAEERAAKLPAIMTIPLIVFILPSLFVIVMGPAILNIADAFVTM